ncbi:RelA/SpoT family protein [Patescibacteria group bacterium]
MTIEQVISKFKQTYPLADTSIIEKAYTFAKKVHNGQMRCNGEPTLEHLIQTAYVLADLKLDSAALAGGILHDTLEDTPTSLKQIKQEFGDEIAFLVESVTFIKKVKYRNQEKANERNAEKTRKILISMAKDIRVILIKLADRIHNMKTLYALSKERQKRLAFETLEIYAPIAYRLGIGEIKGQLEDLAFYYAYPKEYQTLLSQVKNRYSKGKNYIENVIPIIRKFLAKENIPVINIHGRAKHYYSLYKKLLKYDMDWHRIYDLIAIRIIVPDVESCYATLGAIHKQWKPLIGRIKDYIATPKPNSYRSLHTTVFCQNGQITEFQIRTKQMHEETENGIAANWYYSEKKNRTKEKCAICYPSQKLTKEIALVKQLQEWQKEDFLTPEEFFNSLKIDYLKNRIFVFTPKGSVIDLPEGATPIDFAYAVHSNIGDDCAGAKINGKLTRLNSTLKNGQVVEIIIQKNKKPNKDWLNFVKTNRAKARIRAWYNKN